LHAVQNGTGAPNGVWGTAGSFPKGTNGSNYWVDVVFKRAGAVAPSISTQPASETVVSGQTATFTVAATGTAPMSYQWKKNGTAIPGATASSYTTPATTSTDNGAQFGVAVSNSAGTATSNAATLSVDAATTALSANPTSLSFGNVNVGT